MPEKTIKSRLQNCDAALASEDGPIFSTVAKLVQALERLHSRRNVKRGAKEESPAHSLGLNCSAGPGTRTK
jgi:hypothetical protein